MASGRWHSQRPSPGLSTTVLRNPRSGNDRVPTIVCASASGLTAGTPEGRAIVLPLAALADDGVTARAGQSATFVYGLGTRAIARPYGLTHALTRQPQQPDRLVVGHRGKRPPGIDAGGKAQLRLPQIADARHRVLIE